ncbi:MAG: SdpI family protein [Treponema sp.]
MENDNKKLIILTTFICLSPIIWGLYFWNQLPAEIAIHFDLYGNANGFVPKWGAVFFLPIFFAILNFIVNTSTIKQISNKNKSYMSKIAVPVVGILISGFIILKTLKTDITVNSVVFTAVSLFFIFAGNYLPKIRRNKHTGIRLPWIANNDRLWFKTHRFTGYLWVIFGFISLFGSFSNLNIIIFAVSSCTMVILPIIYSLILYIINNRKKP